MACGLFKHSSPVVQHRKQLVRYFSLTRSCNVKNVKLSHSIYDPPGTPSGSPFFITHGLLGSKGNWNAISKAVAKMTNRQVIAFDARNHGDSPHADEHSYEAMAEDVLELAKGLGIKKLSLMGHSMGGRTVMAFALRYPESLEKLVVVDVSPVSMSSDFPLFKKYLETLQAIKFDHRKSISLSEARKIADAALVPVVPELGVRAFLLTNLAESNGKIYWKPNLAVLIKTINGIGAFPEELLSKSFHPPTLFIRGGKSPYILDEDIPGMKRIFLNSKVDTIVNAGHWPHAENVKDFLASLVSFLNS